MWLFQHLFCCQNQPLNIFSVSSATFTHINWWYELPRRAVRSSSAHARKIQSFLKRYPCPLSLPPLGRRAPAAEQTARTVGIQLTSRYLKEEKGGRVAVRLVLWEAHPCCCSETRKQRGATWEAVAPEYERIVWAQRSSMPQIKLQGR